MRLTCPNCGAQYEVPDDIIPVGGRDVQCSNCGNTWFQYHTDDEGAAEAARLETDDATVSEDVASEEATFEEVEPPELSIDTSEQLDDSLSDLDEDPDEIDLDGADWDIEDDDTWDAPTEPATDTAPSEDMPASESAQEDDTDEAAFVEDALDASDEEAATPPEAAQAEAGSRLRRALDASVSDILREEAELEKQTRASEQSQALETQGDLGLESGENHVDQRVSDAQSRMRRLRGEDDRAAAAGPIIAPKGTRRDLLPDIEEVNSTLRKSSDTPRAHDLAPKPQPKARRARGFRLGFALALLLAVASVFVYGSHDSLAQSYPAAAPYIEGFMQSTNSARLWLDDKVAQLLLMLNKATG